MSTLRRWGRDATPTLVPGEAGHRAEQAPGIWVLRAFEDLLDRARLDDAPGLHHRGAVADMLDDAEIVRDEEHRQPELVLQAQQKIEMPATLIRASDPLLQPYTIKHLTLKNRIMSTAHEPNYHEDGMPKDRYRLYHVEKAKGGIALTMTAGSAVVSRDSPPAFGNLLAYKDEIVPWLRKLTDECHEHGAPCRWICARFPGGF